MKNGFSMPEIEIFGVKGKGEKIFLILDTNDQMLIDEIGTYDPAEYPTFTAAKNAGCQIYHDWGYYPK